MKVERSLNLLQYLDPHWKKTPFLKPENAESAQKALENALAYHLKKAEETNNSGKSQSSTCSEAPPEKNSSKAKHTLFSILEERKEAVKLQRTNTTDSIITVRQYLQAITADSISVDFRMLHVVSANRFSVDFRMLDRVAVCNICKQRLSYKTSTSNLRKHMKCKHPTVSLDEATPNTFLGSQEVDHAERVQHRTTSSEPGSKKHRTSASTTAAAAKLQHLHASASTSTSSTLSEENVDDPSSLPVPSSSRPDTSVPAKYRGGPARNNWNIAGKVIFVVTDNADNVVNAVKDVMGWKHMGCFAHSLNLVVTRALNKNHEVVTLIETVKRIVSHFKRSAQSTEKLIEYQVKNNQHVSTRWNSTYFMLKRFVLLQEPIKATLALIDKDLPVLTPVQWKMLCELILVLKPFYTVTKTVSGEKYATGSLVIPLTNSLFTVCGKLKERNFSPLVKEVVTELNKELSKRFGNFESSKYAHSPHIP
ncbi:uncharacterized protein LOC124370373 [Homalodisca vitripennis]|uniref:uncharacterized protein LOC124370373 n=1 Tax=Homalodisca vitripennis TaxID=197043 RepID=UPI001EEA1918|nr:uncharacterized protein LOC124370373 [Homalodisca vitripennis]